MSSSLPTAVVTPIVSTNSEQSRNDVKDNYTTGNDNKLLLWKYKENVWKTDARAPLGSLNETTPLPSLVFPRQDSGGAGFKEPTMLQNVSDFPLLNNCSVALDHIDKSEHDISELTKSLCTTGSDSKYRSETTKRSSRRIPNTRTCTLNRYSDKAYPTAELNLPSNELKGRKRQLKSKSAVSRKRKRKTQSVCQDVPLKVKKMPEPSKLSPYSTRRKKLRTCNNNSDRNKAAETVLSQSEHFRSFSYIPTRNDILQAFASDVTICALCHLPGNFLPGLGDLYGPYRPTCGELMERYDDADSKFSSSFKSGCKRTSVDIEPELHVDQEESTCYVTTSCFKPAVRDQDGESSFQSISGAKKNVHSMLPRMRMLQTVDSILSECNRKNAAKYSKAKRLHIPGFTGKITTPSQQRHHRTERNTDRNLLHDLNTIVFVEPTEQYSHTFFSSLNSTPRRKPSKDGTSVDVLHKFDIKPIWVHSSCAVWSPGVCCAKNQLHGLVTAVLEAANVTCTFCHRSGATIACKYARNRNYHFLCCKASGLALDEETLTVSLPV